MSKAFVLDASAAPDYLERGPGVNKVDQLFRDARRGSATLLLSLINWGEVFYHLWQRHGRQAAEDALNDFSRLPIQVIDADVAHVLKAGELKAVHHIPYVDCFAAALAVLREATLVTSDRDFEKMGRQFHVLWLPR